MSFAWRHADQIVVNLQTSQVYIKERTQGQKKSAAESDRANRLDEQYNFWSAALDQQQSHAIKSKEVYTCTIRAIKVLLFFDSAMVNLLSFIFEIDRIFQGVVHRFCKLCWLKSSYKKRAFPLLRETLPCVLRF